MDEEGRTELRALWHGAHPAMTHSEAEAKVAATLAAAVPAVLYSCDDVNLRPLGSSRRNYRVPTTHIWTARLHTKYIEARMYVGAALKAELSTHVRCFMEFA